MAKVLGMLQVEFQESVPSQGLVEEKLDMAKMFQYVSVRHRCGTSLTFVEFRQLQRALRI